MKKLLTIILILWWTTGYGQADDTTLYINYPGIYGTKQPRFYANKVLRPPNDTIWTKTGLAIKSGLLWIGNGLYWVQAGGSIDWGDIGGTLSNQTDLQAALDAKVNIYNANGILTANRTLTGNQGTYGLTFDSLGSFSVKRAGVTRINMGSTSSFIAGPGTINTVTFTAGNTEAVIGTNSNSLRVKSTLSEFNNIVNYTTNLGASFTARTHIDKGYADSLVAAVVALKVNISDTANAFSNYINNVGWGLIKTGQTVIADSSLLTSWLLTKKKIDSLGALINLGWNVNGNSGLSASANFIGNTDDIPINFKVNNIRSGRIESSTFVGSNLGNTAIGYNALLAPTTGQYNVAIGVSALKNTTTQYQNIAIGVSTMGNISGASATNNIAMGVTTLNAIGYNATNNLAIGHSAMFYDTSGRDNVALGMQSLFKLRSGGYNTAVGNNAMQEGITGSYNVAVGASSNSNNTTGSYNTAVGYGSLGAYSYPTTYSYNIALGRMAGRYNVSGDNEIFINSLDRTNYLGDTTQSAIWIKQHATVSSQKIKLNGFLQLPAYTTTFNQNDTSAYKPLVKDASGNVYNLTYWPSPTVTPIDTANKWVNSISRTLGKDSIIYYIGGTRYAIKDSTGPVAIDTANKWIWKNYGNNAQYSLKQPANAFFDSLKIQKLRIGNQDSAFRDNITANTSDAWAYFTGKTITARDIDTATAENDDWNYAINTNALIERITRLSNTRYTAYRGNMVASQQYEAADSGAVHSIGGDLGYSFQGRTTIANKFGYSGRTIVSGGIAPYEAIPSMIGTFESSHKDGTTGTIRASGYWAAVSGYHNFATGDSIDHFISFLANGYSSGATFKSNAGLVIIPNAITASSPVNWGIYSNSSAPKSLFGSTIGIGTSTLTGTPYGFGTYEAPTFKASALLQINSSTQGFITSRMTAAQRLAISADSALFVWDSDSSRYMGYTGAAWKGVAWRSDITSTSTSPGGSNKQIQFNNSSAFGGAAGFEYQAAASPNVSITAQNAAYTALNVAGTTSQSGDILQVKDVNSNELFSVRSNGSVDITNQFQPWYEQVDGFRTSTDDGFVKSNSGTGSSAAAMTTSDIINGWMYGYNHSTGTTTNGYSYFAANVSGATGAVIALDNAYRYNAGAKVRLEDLSDGTNTYEAFFGFGEIVVGTASIVDGIYFRYLQTDSSGKWIAVTKSNSTKTESATDITVAADTDYELEISVYNGSAYFYINKVLKSTISTNIPTGTARATSGPIGMILKSAGTTARNMYVDWAAFGTRNN
jgi:hypothetical protein